MTENIGRFIIEPELLVELLKLPAGTRVLRFREQPDMQCGTAKLEIVVSGPQLPAVEVGGYVPVVRPMYAASENGDVTFLEYKQ